MDRSVLVLYDAAHAGRVGMREPYDRRSLVALGGPLAAPPPEPRLETTVLSKVALRDLARDPSVQGVAPLMPTALVAPVPGSDVAADPTGGATAWGVAAVGADTSTRTGAGVLVAVLDTGIDAAHAAFAGVELVQQDFTGSGNGDVQGHGTHCAGTVFGRPVDGTRIGVATGVSRALVGKVLGDDGRGDSEMLFRGIQWAAQESARVVSMSIGFDFPGMVRHLVETGWPVDLATSAGLEAYRANLRMFDALMGMVGARGAFSGGTVVVAAAGNESRRGENPAHEIAVSLPAAAEGVLSVGALGQGAGGAYEVAPFSNTLPQLSAPGVGVLSARAGGGLRSLDGTSMATPHAAGVAALWWEEVLARGLPARAATVTAHLLAGADSARFMPGVDVADRGVGLVRAP